MNVLLMSLLYPEDSLSAVTANVKDKLQNQINNYQRAFIQGIRENLAADERLDILNSLPVGVFPLHYRKLLLPTGWHDQKSLYEIGCINLPWFKQKGRMLRATAALRRWASQSPDHRTVLLYTQYLPYMQAVNAVKKDFPDLKACVIVTDLPNELGLASGRRGILKKIEYARGRRSMALCREMDGFVLLTAPMAEALGVEHKKHIVIEGLITESAPMAASCEKKPAVLYTGTLEPDLGIAEMLEAFRQLPEYELWICGAGSMSREVEAYAKQAANIRYFGFVSQQEALMLQAKASVLINPRTPEGTFTRYSFPSKTLEYMRSGKPVVCYRLDGIPSDYDPYLCYIDGVGADAVADALRHILSKPQQERSIIGSAARAYVMRHKNPRAQCKRLVELLRTL